MAVVDPIGYIICESMYQSEAKIIDQTQGGKRVIAKGILQTANEKNRNGRYYPREQLFAQLKAPRTVELLECGYLRGEDGHPLDSSLARQSIIVKDLCAVKYLSLWTEGDDIWATFRGTNNDRGEEFDADLRDGDKPAFSLRALGTINRSSTLSANVVDNIRVITWDTVIYPSHTRAYTAGLVSESGILLPDQSDVITESVEGYKNTREDKPMVIPFDNQQVFNFIQNESANLKYLNDLFDFAYNKITVNENGTKVSLTDKETGDFMVINLEQYVHESIMDYATRYENLV